MAECAQGVVCGSISQWDFKLLMQYLCVFLWSPRLPRKFKDADAAESFDDARDATLPRKIKGKQRPT